MSNVAVVGGTQLTTSLQAMLLAEDILPGSTPSYQICKVIYSFHPLGKKMADSPIAKAQSQAREISIPAGPEDRLRERFIWGETQLKVKSHIFNTMRLSRIYGISSIALMVKDVPADKPVDYRKLSQLNPSFNVLDPLNTAGSLVLNQDPNSKDFQTVTHIAIAGVSYHRSRACVMMNEDPLYIEYTPSAFGFVGRSVYQRALYPLKSFVQTMVTDDMISRKAGLIVAMMESAGSIIDNLMQKFNTVKRNLLKEGETNNVLSIGKDDKVESLNLQNIDGAASFARKDILENIAVSADMPAQMLNSETFAEGFGEGTEDAKNVAGYIDGIRTQMQPLYDFMDPIVMHYAWDEEFYKIIQKDFPDEYGDVEYSEAFYRWKNSFTTQWPSLLTEPPSEMVKTDDVKLKAVLAMLEVLLPNMDPENKVLLIQWACDNFNELKLMFGTRLELDWEALESYVPPEPPKQEEPDGHPMADALTASVAQFLQKKDKRNHAAA